MALPATFAQRQQQVFPDRRAHLAHGLTLYGGQAFFFLGHRCRVAPQLLQHRSMVGMALQLDAQEVGEAGIGRAQLVQRAKFTPAIGVDEQDAVKPVQVRQAVGHANAQRVFPFAKQQVVGDAPLGPYIQRRQRVIQNHHIGRVQYCACQ